MRRFPDSVVYLMWAAIVAGLVLAVTHRSGGVANQTIDRLDYYAPERFKGDSSFILATAPVSIMPYLCAPPNTEPNLNVVACTFADKNLVFMPNPCMFAGDPYADLLCHEKGHINGWSTAHEP